jgi:hypothetical protein
MQQQQERLVHCAMLLIVAPISLQGRGVCVSNHVPQLSAMVIIFIIDENNEKPLQSITPWPSHPSISQAVR